MAGESRRFVEAGYRRPKWMLPIAGRPMLEWAVLSFSQYFHSESFVFAFRDDEDSKSFIHRSLNSVGVTSAKLVDTGGRTRGQAETLSIALQKIGADKDEPVLVFNIDTLVPHFQLPSTQELGDGWLQCVEAEGDGWSFVSPISKGSRRVQQVKEKTRISSFCSTGAYFFRTADLFRGAFQHPTSLSDGQELFIAPLY